MPLPRGLLRWPTYAMGQLHRATNARMEAELAGEGLSLRTYQVLVCLEEFGELSQQQVCDSIVADRSDMVRIVDRLEELGQVVRHRDAVDRRRHRLTLTPAGRGALRRAEEMIDRITSDALSELSESERQTLHRLTLRALGEPLDAADQPASRSA
jgi:DNA-binding MarR family transcriptional regulator